MTIVGRGAEKSPMRSKPSCPGRASSSSPTISDARRHLLDGAR
jgi:hypothetical protein